MGATVAAPPILKRVRPAGPSTTPIASEAMPAYIGPQQELTSMAAVTSDPATQIAPTTTLPAQRRAAALRRMALRYPGNRYGLQESYALHPAI